MHSEMHTHTSTPIKVILPNYVSNIRVGRPGSWLSLLVDNPFYGVVKMHICSGHFGSSLVHFDLFHPPFPTLTTAHAGDLFDSLRPATIYYVAVRG